jgi:hypothetical protein
MMRNICSNAFGQLKSSIRTSPRDTGIARDTMRLSDRHTPHPPQGGMVGTGGPRDLGAGRIRATRCSPPGHPESIY